ncbi:hypothetical protein H2199_007450 [Coniosporium tulheliwenetii]|uniref:Uncharacterized protein n=1 Tax=Coniosporium tulheliwenetii TaxID=3383036 RepID=A0ACC2YPV0_9PEZI|nr:hypothetical protein H2199_007450 [Cladosporium sp. JES 115]
MEWPDALKRAHVQVPYPSEATDENLETSASGLVDPSCWLHGWNFTTDLYRVLEHTVDKLRSRHAFSGTMRPMQAAFATDSFSGPVVLQSVLDVYAQLPPKFKTIPSVTGEQAHDIFGFQAANIQATLQLLRMVLFSAEENVDMDQKCNVAADLLSVFHNAPVAYLKAISTPLIYHLGGIGTILGSVMEGPLSEVSYYRLRGMLLSMADLLENLESGLHRTAGISRGLRAQVDRIDEYMSLQRTKTRVLPPDAMVNPETAIGANTLPNLSAAAAPSGNALPLLHGTHAYSPTEFQLPPELLEDWPWPLEVNSQEFGFSWPGVDPSGWEITV